MMKLPRSGPLLALLLWGPAIGACSSGNGSGQERVCEPGRTDLCFGSGRCEGVQSCADDGMAWGPCECEDTVTGQASGAGNTASGGRRNDGDSPGGDGGSAGVLEGETGGAPATPAGGVPGVGSEGGAPSHSGGSLAAAGGDSPASEAGGAPVLGGAGSLGVAGSGPGGAAGSASGVYSPECSDLKTNAEGAVLIAATPEHNYGISFEARVTVTPVDPTANILFSWGDATADVRGLPLDPVQDVELLWYVLWGIPLEEFEYKMSHGDLEQRDTQTIALLSPQNGSTEASFFDFTAPGGTAPLPQDVFLDYLNPGLHPPDSHTHTVMLCDQAVVNMGAVRQVQAFVPDPSSTNSTVVIDSSSAELRSTVDLRRLEPTLVPKAAASLLVDWSSLVVGASGAQIIPAMIHQVVVAQYSQTLAELEARFPELETLASETWMVDVSGGTSQSLDAATTEDGLPFPGIDSSHTWILALYGTESMNSAPWYLTVLEPCDG